MIGEIGVPVTARRYNKLRTSLIQNHHSPTKKPALVRRDYFFILAIYSDVARRDLPDHGLWIQLSVQPEFETGNVI